MAAGVDERQADRQTQPREAVPSMVARQNLSPIASWLATGCGQAAHAASGTGARVTSARRITRSRGEVTPSGATAGVLVAEMIMAVLA